MQSNNQELQTAIEQENVSFIKQQNASTLIDFTVEHYNNCFLYAVRKSSLQVVQIIYEKIRAQSKDTDIVYAFDKSGRNAIMLLCVRNENDSEKMKARQILTSLVTLANYNLSFRDKKDYSALTWCIYCNNPDMFRLLLHYRVEMTEFDLSVLNNPREDTKAFRERYFHTPEALLDSVCAGSKEATKFCLRFIKGKSDTEQRAFLDAEDAFNRHALLIAAEKSYLPLYKQLAQMNFNLCVLAEEKYSLFYFLQKNGWRDEIESLEAAFVQRLYVADSDYVKVHLSFILQQHPEANYRNIARAITVNIGVKQQGVLSKFHQQEMQSAKRSYHTERERQLLRHVSSQLYFYLKNKVGTEKNKLVEIQTMHLAYEQKNFLFIAANHSAVSGNLLTYIQHTSVLKDILQTAHTEELDDEGRIRSARFAKKLSERVFAEEGIMMPDADTDEDKMKAGKIAALLGSGSMKPLLIDQKNPLMTKMALESSLRTENNIIFICDVQYWKTAESLRHAEEFLVDLLEYVAVYAKMYGHQYTSCIGGKKRPCLGCYSRMQMAGVDKHGMNHGRFWLNTIDQQNVPVTRNTVRLLESSQAHITYERSKNLPDYDSGSDTDGE